MELVRALLPSVWSAIAWLGLLAALVHIARVRGPASPGIYRALVVVGFGITWFFMLSMTADDIARFASIGEWMRDSNLFFDAYRRVTERPAAFWYSSQLMGAALIGTLLMQRECRSRDVALWPYSFLLMCVAASVTLGAFVGRIEELPRSRRSRATWPVAILLAIAALALIALPNASDEALPWIMIGLHGALLLPALGVGGAQRQELSAGGEKALLLALAAFCVGLHVWASARLLETSAHELIEVLRDPAQASITSDLALTIVGLGIVVARHGSTRRVALAVALAPVLSLGAVAAYLAIADD